MAPVTPSKVRGRESDDDSTTVVPDDGTATVRPHANDDTTVLGGAALLKRLHDIDTTSRVPPELAAHVPSPEPARTPGGDATTMVTNDPPEDTTAPTPKMTPTTKGVAIDSGLGAGAMRLESNTMLGEYRIETEIGEGGMGTVFAAIHPLIGKRVAIKVLKKQLCADPASVERFIDEARVVNQIGHRNIVDVFAFGEMPDGRHYFVMEWLRGETLLARIRRAPLTVSEACVVLRPLCRALEAVHAHGVIHRDLKPDNVFLVSDGGGPLVKLLDFGLAKLGNEDRRVGRTAVGTVVGTPQYIAPEQARGYAIDHRADIYSLGAIVFEMLTGRAPFIADNAAEMVAKHLMEPPPKVSTFATVPVEIDELVTAMLSKDPQRRPSLADVSAIFDRASRRNSTVVGSERPFRAASQAGARGPDGAAWAGRNPRMLQLPPSKQRSRVWVLGGILIVVATMAAVAFSLNHCNESKAAAIKVDEIPASPAAQSVDIAHPDVAPAKLPARLGKTPPLRPR